MKFINLIDESYLKHSFFKYLEKRYSGDVINQHAENIMTQAQISTLKLILAAGAATYLSNYPEPEPVPQGLLAVFSIFQASSPRHEHQEQARAILNTINEIGSTNELFIQIARWAADTGYQGELYDEILKGYKIIPEFKEAYNGAEFVARGTGENMNEAHYFDRGYQAAVAGSASVLIPTFTAPTLHSGTGET